MRRLLREPLLHFLAAGRGAVRCCAASPRGDAARAPGRRSSSRAARSSSLAERLRAHLAAAADARGARGRSSTTTSREEIFYREALALGLDRDDTDRAPPAAPEDGVPRRGREAPRAAPTRRRAQAPLGARTPSASERAARVTFRQVYLSRDRRRTRLDADARARCSRGSRAVGRRPGAAGDPLCCRADFDDLDARAS